jgi:hypothetical protein
MLLMLLLLLLLTPSPKQASTPTNKKNITAPTGSDVIIPISVRIGGSVAGMQSTLSAADVAQHNPCHEEKEEGRRREKVHEQSSTAPCELPTSACSPSFVDGFGVGFPK